MSNVASKEPNRRYGQKLAELEVAASKRQQKDPVGEDRAQIAKKARSTVAFKDSAKKKPA